MAETFIINEFSQPDLDQWGWDSYWSAADWMSWHKIMKAKLGKSVADGTFLKYWNQQGFGASPLDARSFNESFRTYFKSEKLLDDLYDNAAWLKPLGAGTDIISNTSNAASSVSNGMANFLKYGLPIALILLFSGISYWGYTKYLKTA